MLLHEIREEESELMQAWFGNSFVSSRSKYFICEKKVIAAAGPLTLYLLSCVVVLTAKRLKKGMATAKQRLGKILKIHRNGKLLL